MTHLPDEDDLQIQEEVMNNLIGTRYQDLSIAKIRRPLDRKTIYADLWKIAHAKVLDSKSGSPEIRVIRLTTGRSRRSEPSRIRNFRSTNSTSSKDVRPRHRLVIAY